MYPALQMLPRRRFQYSSFCDTKATLSEGLKLYTGNSRAWFAYEGEKTEQINMYAPITVIN